MNVNSRRLTIRVLALASGTFTLGTTVSGVICAVILDALVQRPVPASVTTLIPGFVYASATVMKVCIVTGLASAIMALLALAWPGDAKTAPGATNSLTQGLPIWGVISVTLAPLAPLVGAVAVVIAEVFAHKPAGLSLSDLSQVSRVAVLVKLSMISTGAVAAVISLIRRERPGLLPALGLIVNCLLIGLFWRLEFYALGFDQDTWAPR